MRPGGVTTANDLVKRRVQIEQMGGLGCGNEPPFVQRVSHDVQAIHLKAHRDATGMMVSRWFIQNPGPGQPPACNQHAFADYQPERFSIRSSRFGILIRSLSFMSRQKLLSPLIDTAQLDMTRMQGGDLHVFQNGKQPFQLERSRPQHHRIRCARRSSYSCNDKSHAITGFCPKTGTKYIPALAKGRTVSG